MTTEIDGRKIVRSKEFFGYYTEEELLVRDEQGHTVEETLLFGQGENVSFFKDLEEYDQESEGFNAWVEFMNYKILTTFLTIDERVAVVLISK